jgi:hypothetical protein
MDDALVALCAARPTTEDEQKLRRRYPSSIDIAASFNGCEVPTKRAIKALIEGVA